MSATLIAAALALGSGLIGGGMGRRDSKKAAEQARKNLELALGEYDKGIGVAEGGLKNYDAAMANLRDALTSTKEGISVIDRLKPAIDKFAQAGQGSYDRYSRMLGPMEESLNNYYSNLSPDELAAQGNQAVQQEYQSTMNQLNDQLAANGVLTSGMQAQMAMNQGNQMAQSKAQNRMNAPHQVAQQQQGWNNYLANQGNQAFNQYGQGVQAQSRLGDTYQQAYANLGNAYGNMSNLNQNAANYKQGLGNMYTNKANLYAGIGNQNMQQAGNAQRLGNQSLGSGLGLGAYLGEKANWSW